MNNYFTNNDYIGATGNFPINDYIDYTSNILNTKIDNINININSNIYSNLTNLKNETYHINSNNPYGLIKLKTHSGIPHTYIINSNLNGEIRFNTLGSFVSTFPYNYDHAVKIDLYGKLQVYHVFNLLQPTFPAGWYDVEGEILATKNQQLLDQIEVAGIAGAVAGHTVQLGEIETAIVNLGATDVAQQAQLDAVMPAKGSEILYMKGSDNATQAIDRIKTFIERDQNRFKYRVYKGTQWAVGTFAIGAVSAIAGYYMSQHLSNVVYDTTFTNFTPTPSERSNIMYETEKPEKEFTLLFMDSNCNLNLQQGFINCNITTSQFIPSLKSNKIMLGNITTPNSAYQMEMTGNLNLNELYINSTSLTSLLNQKQNNISTTAPIYLTTANIGINYDSTLTKIGNNLSVVKTATQPLVWTGNDISLNYDSSLTKVGNNLSVASATASKWTTSGNNIYNNNSANVGIGSLLPEEKLTVGGNTYINGITTIGVPKLNPAITTSGGTGGSSLILVANSDPAEYYQEFTSGGGTIILSEPCSADILCVGAGGNGGTGASSGGGGAGEVIYYPNFPLRAGTLNIQVGASGTNVNNRISRIYPTSGNEIMRARGGGDGGYFTSYTANGSVTVNENTIAIFNYTTTVNISPATYSITFSQGSITLSGIAADKSYPLLKDANNNTINPTIWYKFDTNATQMLVDSGSSGSYTLTNNNSTFDGTNFSKGNGSVFVDNGKNVSIASNINFYSIQTTNGISFSLWIKLTGGTTFGRIFHFSGTNQSADGLCAICRDAGTTGIQLNLWTTSSNRAIISNSSYNYFNNTWYFLTWTISSTGVWSFYVNGSSVSITATTFSFDSTKSYNVNKVLGGNYLSEYVTGNIDDFRIYSFDLTSTQVSELYNGRVNIYNNPTSGGSGGGGALSQTGSIAGTKFDEYKSFVQAGLNGSSTTGGNGGSGSSLYNTRFTSTITGSSLSVGLGGSGVLGTPTPATKTNYGDGGDGNGGSGYGGIVIVRFKANTNYLQVKAIKNNGNSGLIINANETISGTTTPYQLKIYPFQDTYTTTGITTRGYTFQTSDGITNTELLNLFSYFGGRVGIKTRNPASVLDVNGDITCKTFNVVGDELYGINCQIVNQHAGGEASLGIYAGQGTSYGGLALYYLPSQNLGYISCSKNLKIKTGNDAANSYIYIDNSTGNVGIGLQNPSSRLEVSGTITTNNLASSIIYGGEIQSSIINNYDGNIVNNKNLFSSNIYVNNFIDCQNKPIYNCSYLYGTADIAKEWKAITNYYHKDDQGRDRIYFKNDTTGSPPNHFTLFKSGGTTHVFADKDDVQYCILDRFSITTFMEVISGSGYDNVGVADGVSTGTYVFRKLFLRLSTFTEVHRCFCEDELFNNYDDFINEYIGRVVVSKGKIKTALKEADKEWQILEGKDGITIDDSHPVVELSRKKKDKAVVGVITKRNNSSDMPNRLVINSLGETAIWVVNTNGNLENGDLLTTSNELGFAEKQDCDFIKNYSIGKIMIDCNFELDSPNYKCELIDETRDLRKAFLPIFIYSG